VHSDGYAGCTMAYKMPDLFRQSQKLQFVRELVFIWFQTNMHCILIVSKSTA